MHSGFSENRKKKDWWELRLFSPVFMVGILKSTILIHLYLDSTFSSLILSRPEGPKPPPVPVGLLNAAVCHRALSLPRFNEDVELWQLLLRSHRCSARRACGFGFVCLRSLEWRRAEREGQRRLGHVRIGSLDHRRWTGTDLRPSSHRLRHQTPHHVQNAPLGDLGCI